MQNDVYIPPKAKKSKDKNKEQKKCDDDELLAMFNSMPTAEQFAREKELSQKDGKKKKKQQELQASTAQWDKLQTQMESSQ